MKKIQAEKKRAYDDGKKGILYPESHLDYEINRKAYDGYIAMRVDTILVRNLNGLLR